MKKMKWLGATGAALAIGAAGLLTMPSSPASGVTPVITAGTGSSISCVLNGGAASLSPTLKDNWTPNPNDPTTSVQTFKDAIASIPSQTFSSNGPVTTTVKDTATCTGTVVDPTQNNLSTSVLTAKIAGLSIGTDTGPATCGGLATAALSGETFSLTITYAGTIGGPKIAPTTIAAGHLAALALHGVGFTVTASGSGPTGIQGSFAGGTSTGNTYIDQTSLTDFTAAVLGTVPTFAAPVTPSTCEPSLSIKSSTASGLASDAVAIKMKAPKGLKKISFVNSGTQLPAPDVATDSTLVMTVP